MKRYFAAVLAVILFFGCSEFGKIIKKESPHEQYEDMLRESGLINSALGKAWLKASTDALNEPLPVQLPYNEQAYFFNEKATAFSYRVSGKRGEKIVVTVDKDSSYKIFIDLFTLSKNPEHEAYAASEENRLEYEIEEDADLVVRIQPELLKGGAFSLTISKTGSLAFPVMNKNSSAVHSIWGDPRDGGKRLHEGVDIFAPKRTPVVAAGDGFITRTGTNHLGGKVVWLLTGGKSLYYAHLDSQIVSPGMYVKTGDTLGLVGNTGNAATTPSHLHFGIYYPGEGAVNPYPFIRNVFPSPAKNTADAGLIGEWGRVKSKTALLKSSPGVKEKTLARLRKSAPFIVYGVTGSWFKVKMPDNQTGYINSASVESAGTPLNNFSVNAGESLQVKVGDNVMFITQKQDQSLPLFGSYEDYNLTSLNNSMLLVKKS